MGLLRKLFGPKKSKPSISQPTTTKSSKEKKRWSFTTTTTTTSSSSPSTSTSSNPKPDTTQTSHFTPNVTTTTASIDANMLLLDPNKHAIAVAAATAAVAEAALAAAHAAAEVVRLTGRGGGSGSQRRFVGVAAAVRIQSTFRGYLARRALRALKALVKLQALVRGYLVRKQTADMLRRMQTLVRLQARARATRATLSEPCNSSTKSSHSRSTVTSSPRKDHLRSAYNTKSERCVSNSRFGDIIELERARMGSNHLQRWMEETIWNSHDNMLPRNYRLADDEKSDKILEVDTWEPHMKPQRGNPRYLNHMIFTGKDENSPRVYSESSRPGSSCGSRRGNVFTPTRSEYSWGLFNGYSGFPNYMANTESYRAKVRSQSAPKQRLELDRYSSTSRRLRQGSCDADTRSESGFIQYNDFRNTAYSGSSRLNRIGSSNLR